MDNWITARSALDAFEAAGIPIADACEMMRRALGEKRLLCQAVYREESSGSDHKPLSAVRGEVPAVVWQWLPTSGPRVRRGRRHRMRLAVATADWIEGRFWIRANLAFVQRRYAALSRMNRARFNEPLKSMDAEKDEADHPEAGNHFHTFEINGLLVDRYGVGNLILAARQSYSAIEPAAPKAVMRKPGRPPTFNKQAIIEDVVRALLSEGWSPKGRGEIQYVVDMIERLGDDRERVAIWGGVPGETRSKEVARDIVANWANSRNN